MNHRSFVACAALFSAVALAQDIAVPLPPDVGNIACGGSEERCRAVQAFDVAMTGGGMRFEGRPVKDAPYSAEAISESTQTLADGNRIRRENRTLIYRDSQGRTRREETMTGIGPWPAGDTHVTVFINDPVSGAHYILNPAERTGRKLPQPRLGKQTSVFTGTNGGDNVMWKTKVVTRQGDFTAAIGPGVGLGVGPGVANRVGGMISAVRLNIPAETKQEDLGTRMIEGVNAAGTRSTTTIPAEQIGADRNIEITFERWHSEALGVDVLTKRNDPRMGETTYRLTNINLTEPLPGLFEPAADYEIVEMPHVTLHEAPAMPSKP